MKKLVFAILMCVAAMSAKAQVLTSETVNSVYSQVSNQTGGDFAYNAELTGKDITEMYVYQRLFDLEDETGLKTYLKYTYTYADDGMLTSRVTYRWNDGLCDWVTVARYDYTLANGSYYAEYSRYNHRTERFDQPVERIVYTLFQDDIVNCISYYHRESPAVPFQLVCKTAIDHQTLLIAEKQNVKESYAQPSNY